MLERYKKTLIPTQAVILTVTLAILVYTRAWIVAGAFFATMQYGALAGALWAARLKRMFDRNGARLL